MPSDWRTRAGTAAEVVQHVRSGMTVFLHGAAATPTPLIEALSARGVHVGTGAACASALAESRVLRAMGIDSLYNQGGIRISLGLRTAAAALDRFIEVFPEAYAAAMEKSPYR